MPIPDYTEIPNGGLVSQWGTANSNWSRYNERNTNGFLSEEFLEDEILLDPYIIDHNSFISNANFKILKKK